MLGEHDQVDVLLVELTYADGSGTDVELYQVPLCYYTEPEHRLDHAFVGWWEDPDRGWVHAYDALHDRNADPPLADRLRRATARSAGWSSTGCPVTTSTSTPSGRCSPASSPTRRWPSARTRCSSSSARSRRARTPTSPPTTSLTRVGSERVAQLYGWVEAGGDDTLHLGMLQQFLRTATDGWELALTSVRNLFVDPDVAARDAGGDFAGEAARLGEALREVHDVLRREILVDPALVPTPAAIASAMSARLDAALLVVPGLDEHASRLREAYAALGALPEVPVQQVHGDLHLGQTLRTSLGWKIVDFEGEPAKPLADRLLPDSPWRDVAGMLRSFDYAPPVVERDLLEPDDPERAVLRIRGDEWAERNQRYFLQAYAGGDLTAEQDLLVHAYLADKAVYETVYETRNRPTWVDIPLAGLARISGPTIGT